ncbi:MAG: hypothetical protein QM811_02110 [Pirellulales bacterium]
MGTSLMLGMMDLGGLFGAPLVGATVTLAGRIGWPPFPTMFTAVAAIFTLTTAWYLAQSAAPRRSSR